MRVVERLKAAAADMRAARTTVDAKLVEIVGVVGTAKAERVLEAAEGSAVAVETLRGIVVVEVVGGLAQGVMGKVVAGLMVVGGVVVPILEQLA